MFVFMFTVLKADEKSMNKILTNVCGESRCHVMVSRRVRLASPAHNFGLYADCVGFKLLPTVVLSSSTSTNSRHLQRMGVSATGLKSHVFCMGLFGNRHLLPCSGWMPATAGGAVPPHGPAGPHILIAHVP